MTLHLDHCHNPYISLMENFAFSEPAQGRDTHSLEAKSFVAAF